MCPEATALACCQERTGVAIAAKHRWYWGLIHAHGSSGEAVFVLDSTLGQQHSGGVNHSRQSAGRGAGGRGAAGPSLPAHRCQLFSQAAGRDGLVPSCPPRLTLLRASAPPGWGGHPCSGSRLFPAALAWLRGDLVGGWGEGKTLNRLFPNEVWRQLERGRILLFSCLLLSPARGGGDVYPRFLCWFAASSVSFLCRPQSVLARFRFLCSQLSAQREKGKNKRVGGVGGMVAGRKPSRSPWPGQRSVGMGTGQRLPWGPRWPWWPLSPRSPWHYFGHLCSNASPKHHLALLVSTCW